MPALAYKIDREMDSDELPVKIRLKGIFIGSGLSDPGKVRKLLGYCSYCGGDYDGGDDYQ